MVTKRASDWARRLTLVSALAALAPAAEAQMVVGRVVERGGGGPVVGAMVRLQTVAGSSLAGGCSSTTTTICLGRCVHCSACS